MSKKEKEVFVKMFQNFDRLFAQLKSFTNYDDSMLENYDITQEEYDNYAGHYKNILEWLKSERITSEEINQKVHKLIMITNLWRIVIRK